jgi:hypothetical protein
VQAPASAHAQSFIISAKVGLWDHDENTKAVNSGTQSFCRNINVVPNAEEKSITTAGKKRTPAPALADASRNRQLAADSMARREPIDPDLLLHDDHREFRAGDLYARR